MILCGTCRASLQSQALGSIHDYQDGSSAAHIKKPHIVKQELTVILPRVSVFLSSGSISPGMADSRIW